MAFADEEIGISGGDDDQSDGGDYQRVVFDEDGLVYNKHTKYKRPR